MNIYTYPLWELLRHSISPLERYVSKFQWKMRSWLVGQMWAGAGTSFSTFLTLVPWHWHVTPSFHPLSFLYPAQCTSPRKHQSICQTSNGKYTSFDTNIPRKNSNLQKFSPPPSFFSFSHTHQNQNSSIRSSLENTWMVQNERMMDTRQKRPDVTQRDYYGPLDSSASSHNSKKIRIVDKQRPTHLPWNENPPSSCFFLTINDDLEQHGVESLNTDSPNPTGAVTKAEVPLDRRTDCGKVIFVDASTAPHLIAHCPQFPSLSDLEQNLSAPSFALQPRSQRRPKSWPGGREPRYTCDFFGLWTLHIVIPCTCLRLLS